MYDHVRSSDLGGRQSVIEDDPLRTEHFRADPNFIRLSGADIQTGIDVCERLRHGVHRIHFAGLGQFRELRERVLKFLLRDRLFRVQFAHAH